MIPPRAAPQIVLDLVASCNNESNATCGKRLASIGLENTEANRQAYRTLMLVSATGLGQYISGAILFKETLYQSTIDGKKMVGVHLTEHSARHQS